MKELAGNMYTRAKGGSRHLYGEEDNGKGDHAAMPEFSRDVHLAAYLFLVSSSAFLSPY